MRICCHGLHGLARIDRGNQQAGFYCKEFSVSPKMIYVDNIKYLALICELIRANPCNPWQQLFYKSSYTEWCQRGPYPFIEAGNYLSGKAKAT